MKHVAILLLFLFLSFVVAMGVKRGRPPLLSPVVRMR
jgi:hypothetical protein